MALTADFWFGCRDDLDRWFLFYYDLVDPTLLLLLMLSFDKGGFLKKFFFKCLNSFEDFKGLSFFNGLC